MAAAPGGYLGPAETSRAETSRAETSRAETSRAETTDPVLLAEGGFVSHEHGTSGTAPVVRHPDGSRRPELVELDTSNGPDLRVWQSDQPVIEGLAGWAEVRGRSGVRE